MYSWGPTHHLHSGSVTEESWRCLWGLPEAFTVPSIHACRWDIITLPDGTSKTTQKHPEGQGKASKSYLVSFLLSQSFIPLMAMDSFPLSNTVLPATIHRYYTVLSHPSQILICEFLSHGMLENRRSVIRTHAFPPHLLPWNLYAENLNSSPRSHKAIQQTFPPLSLSHLLHLL